MPWVDDQFSSQFHSWERQGRGWKVWDVPVMPEAAFKPFDGYNIDYSAQVDDGRRPTFLSSLFSRLRRKLQPEPPPRAKEGSQDEELEPEILERDDLIELPISFPPDADPSPEVFAHFLETLEYSREALGFELVGTHDQIFSQFSAHPADISAVQRQLQALFPTLAFVQRKGIFPQLWHSYQGTQIAVAEFGLDLEFMIPLGTVRHDVHVGLTAPLAELDSNELGAFQVLFQPVRNPWNESALQAVSNPEGKPAFVNAPDLLKHAERKVSQRLFAAVVRLATRANPLDRAWDILRDMASALCAFADARGNELIPLANDHYPFDAHAEDVFRRQSRRSGMILNQDELLGLVHLPSAAVKTPRFKRQIRRTKRAPSCSAQPTGLFLGHNLHNEEAFPVHLPAEHRVRHLHVIGGWGTGKSTLLFNMIKQDIEKGEGLAVLDPHGDLIDQILGIVPDRRIEDVVLLDPSDEQYSVGFNILSAHSEVEKNLLASDLVSVFKRLSTSWGDQMGIVLTNAILALLASSRGGTLADLRRFLLEPKYRDELLKTVRDPEILYFWHRAFGQLTGNKSIGPVVTRLQTFLSRKSIRLMVSQKENRLNFADILNGRKILLAKLSQGAIGQEESFLFGTLLVAKIHQVAIGRQSQSAETRADFWMYLDEFQNFVTPSMAEMLTGARKYRLGLILAHHNLQQLKKSPDVETAALSTPNRVCFRCGEEDARKLREGFSYFEWKDLLNLDIGEAICRVERGDYDFNLTVPLPPKQDATEAADRRRRITEASRRKYGTPRAEVEENFQHDWHEDQSSPRKGETKAPPKDKPPRSSPASDIAPQESAPPSPEASVPDTEPADRPHEDTKTRIKTEALSLDYTANTEVKILDGRGRIDVVVERGTRRIACQVCSTTNAGHEIANANKCLEAGFTFVALIFLTPRRADNFAQAVKDALAPKEAGMVHCFLLSDFMAKLNDWAMEDPAGGAAERAKPRPQSVSLANELSPQERDRISKERLRKLAERMKRDRRRED